MALKQEIILWDEGAKFHDVGDFEASLQTFYQISDTSRILFNCGVIHASLGEHAEAVTIFRRAVEKDQYLAIAYFQCGVSNFLLGEFEDALMNFNDTISCLRGNDFIDYDQLGLKYKLFFCEVLFNRGLCYIYLQQKIPGMEDLRVASARKMSEHHNVIDEAIQEEAAGFVVFSIPRGIIYRPNAAKVKNLTSKDYLGRARLIAAQQERRNQSMAPTVHRRNISETSLPVDPSREQILNGVTTNIMKPGQGLPFRSRQQSEPPRHRRELFPPTPPPEDVEHKSKSFQQRRGSGSSSGSNDRPAARPQHQRSKSRPGNLDLGAAAFDSSSQQRPEKPRLGTRRAASEQPRSRTKQSSPRHEVVERKEVRRSLRVDTQDTYTLSPDIYQAVNRSLEEAPKQQKQQSQQQTQPPLLQPVSYNQQRSKSKARLNTQRPVSIEEECEDDNQDSHPDSAVSGIPPAPVSSVTNISTSTLTPNSAYPSTDHHYHHDLLPFEILPPGGSAAPRRQTPVIIELSKVRVKVHGERDTRYVMIKPDVLFDEFVELVRKKFGLLCSDRATAAAGGSGCGGGYGEFKLKVRDEEGDMVTLGDQEDLDMAVQGCRDSIAATVGGGEGSLGPQMGKMEVWVHEI